MKIAESVYWVGVDDHQTKLFESLWSLPRGVSYNSYLITGNSKKVLIDTVKKGFFDTFLENIKRYIDPKELDYIILNHVEPDHAGSLSRILSLAPKASVVGSEKAIDFVKKYHPIEFNTIVVKDSETIDLGEKTLKFFDATYIHWPETIFTYLIEDGILFSGDAFGSFGSIGENIFDDRDDKGFFLDEAKRYFTSIISPYSPFVMKSIKKLETMNMQIKTIAPSHGLVYRSNPSEIISLYRNLSSCIPEKKVIIVYGSMYGNTEALANAVAKGVSSKNVKPVIFNISYADISEVLSEIWTAPTIAIGSPVYDSFIFPPITNLLEMIKLKRIKARKFGVFGSFTWGGTPLEQMRKQIESIGSEIIGATIKSQGSPTQNILSEAETLGEMLADITLEKVNEVLSNKTS